MLDAHRKDLCTQDIAVFWSF
jgi:hypothetical protein